MIQKVFDLKINAVGSDDKSNTYEIRRTFSREGKKALVIELYPTLSVDNASDMDLSAMHLMNHSTDLGWNDVRVVNLYSNVFAQKPLVGELNNATSSLAYIEEILEEKDIKDYEIVIAWGSALAKHKQTINMKIDILTMLKEKGLQGCVRCLNAESMIIEENYGTHPLFLGLHYGKENWYTMEYPLEQELDKLTTQLKGVMTESAKSEKGGKKNANKTKK